MPWVPELGETGDTESWSDSQTKSYIFVTYLMVLAFLSVLALAAVNFWQFILAST